jgi:hypothetical protein
VVASTAGLVNQVRRLVHARSQEAFFVEVDAKQQREMGDLDDCTVDPHVLGLRHAILQRHKRPREDVAWSNVGEEGVVLRHRDGVYGKREPKDRLELTVVPMRETYWYSSLALETMDMNELVRTVMSIVLAVVSLLCSRRFLQIGLQNDKVADDEEQSQKRFAHPVI